MMPPHPWFSILRFDDRLFFKLSAVPTHVEPSQKLLHFQDMLLGLRSRQVMVRCRWRAGVARFQFRLREVLCENQFVMESSR